MIELERDSIHAWIDNNNIKTDTGLPLDFKDHSFIWDIYSDFSPKQVWMKAAQITASTCATLKSFFIAKNKRMDLIYTLPTEADRNIFVGGKVNRIIAQNPILQRWTKDKDSIEQKRVGDNFIHFRGTWTQKAAIMIPSDLNIYDEVDASKQDVIEAIGKGRMYVVRGENSLDFKLSEFYISDESEAVRGFVGDSVTLEGAASLHLKGRFLKEQQSVEVNVIKDGQIVKTYSAESPFDIAYYDDEISQGWSYYRLEIIAKGLRLVTNPIFAHRITKRALLEMSH